MARPTGSRFDDLKADHERLEDRVAKIERMIWVAVYGAAGIGFVVGAFARDFAHVLLGLGP